MSNKVLEVKKMKISFRTNNGAVKAVRDISFDLYKGETLAIVGESGSGKSVTSKAILGILAGNAIIDGGEILYDGKDLLKVPESEMHKIRGDKIAMVFQDPLSSLNPIVKIGKQITEAMILKNRAARVIGKKEFNSKLRVLKEVMNTVTNNEQKEHIENYTKQIYKTMDCCGVVRVDYLMDESREHVYVNEINTIPGSFSFYLWEHNDLPFGKLLDVLIEEALNQAKLRKDKVLKYDSKILDNLTRNGKQGGCKR